MTAALLALALGLGGCANPCERLCDAYFQMELRCELLSCDACSTDDVCEGEVPPTPDGNVLLQEAEYKIQQCQSDYRRLVDGTDGLLSEGDSCQAYVPTMESLVDQYDGTSDSCVRRALCQQYEALQGEMGL